MKAEFNSDFRHLSRDPQGVEITLPRDADIPAGALSSLQALYKIERCDSRSVGRLALSFTANQFC